MAKFDQFNLDSTEEDIVQEIQNYRSLLTVNSAEELDVYFNYLSKLLDIKQQKKLLDGQNDFNNELIVENKKLNKATKWMLGVAIISIFVSIVVAFTIPPWEISLRQKAEEKSDIQSLYQTIIANEDIFISNFNAIRHAQNNNLPISVPEQYIEFPIKENVHKTIQREFGIDGYRFLLYFLNQTDFLNQKTIQIKNEMIKNSILMSKDSKIKDYQVVMSSLEDGNWESSKLNYINDTSCLLFFFQKSFPYIEIADREKTMTCSSESLNRLFYHFGYIAIETPKWIITELRKALNERKVGLGDRLIQEVK